jgi:uncharacterized membrane protein
MKLDNRVLLVLACCFTLFLFPVTAFSSGFVRITLSLVCLLFLPGYAMISALFPRQGTLDLLERIVLSIGLSIAIVPLIGLALNYSPWGIRLDPILIAVAAFIFAMAFTGIVRQQLLPEDQRFSITLNFSWPVVRGMNLMSGILLVLVVVAGLALAGIVAYSAVKPLLSPRPTEFYILNAEGKAENYPRLVKPGSPVNVTVTVVNNEALPTAYRVKITCAGAMVKDMSTGTLASGGKWQQQTVFSLPSIGQNKKVDFQLYKGDTAEPYFKEPLYLYIDVAD